jgi:hypothetical protein
MDAKRLPRGHYTRPDAAAHRIEPARAEVRSDARFGPRSDRIAGQTTVLWRKRHWGSVMTARAVLAALIGVYATVLPIPFWPGVAALELDGVALEEI